MDDRLGVGGLLGRKTDGRAGLELYNIVSGSFSHAVWKVWSNDLTCYLVDGITLAL